MPNSISQNVTWTSSNKNAVTIDAYGNIKGIYEGSAVITVTSTVDSSITTSFTVNVAPIPNGTYTIANKRNDETNLISIGYLDIHGPTSSVGEYVHLWQFYGHNSQQWYVEHQAGGYYTIKSVHSGLYLGVENDSTQDGAAIKMYSYSTSWGQRWEIEITDSGAYRIIPRCSESNDMALGLVFGGVINNGTQIKQRTYTADTDFSDEWFFECDNSITICHYYDQGAKVRYGIEGHTMFEHIITVQNEVAEILFELYGIKIFSTYIEYTSLLDECKGIVNSTTINNICSCGNNCISSQKLINEINEDFGNGSSKTLRVIWTGHDMGQVRSGASPDFFSITLNPYYFVHGINAANSDYDFMVDRNQYSLLHELGHIFTAPDHYCYGNKPCSNNFCDECYIKPEMERVCFMEQPYILSELNIEDYYCTLCDSRIETYLQNHY